MKVTVLGAGGSIGQPLSLLLKLSPLVNELALYDRNRAPGVAVDLSHIPSKANVRGYTASNSGLVDALANADIVIHTAGYAVIPGFTSRDDLFQRNAVVTSELAKEYARICPSAVMLVLANPINGIVPFTAELLRSYGAFNAKKLIGVTTLDVVRAETFVMAAEGRQRGKDMGIPVVGGHSPETIVPLFSQVEPPTDLREAELEGLIRRVQYGGYEVFFAKHQNGAAALSTAYAVFRLFESVCRALQGVQGITECSFVFLPGIDGGKAVSDMLGVEYYAMPVRFGLQGAEEIFNPLTSLSPNEDRHVKSSVSFLLESSRIGVDAANACISNSSKWEVLNR